MRRSTHVVRVLCLAAATALACSGGRGTSATPAPASTRAPARSRRIVRVADANTAAILLTANNVILASARLAPTRARSRDVKLLALNIVTDHTSMNGTLSRLLAAVDITPREDDVSRLMRDQASERRDTLRDLTGSAFDSTYVDGEIRFHQDLLVALDSVFLPSVRNARLREYVTTIRPTISAHLALAEQVRDALAAAR